MTEKTEREELSQQSVKLIVRGTPRNIVASTKSPLSALVLALVTLGEFPNSEYVITAEDGRVLDPGKTLSQNSVGASDRVFINLRAGVDA